MKILVDGPPCLAILSKLTKDPAFDGKDRFMYNYHVFAKMKFADNWQQKVMNAPVKFFAGDTCKCMGSKIFKSKSKIMEQKHKRLYMYTKSYQ